MATQQETRQTLAPEELGEPIGDPEGESKPLVEEPEDISPDDLLVEESVAHEDFFTLPSGKKIKLSSITEQELDMLTGRSKKPDKTDPRRPPRVDALTLRRQMVAYSMSKAAGRVGTAQEIQGPHLMKLPPGLITEMQRKVQELSGFVEEPRQATDPMAYFG